MNLSHLSLLGRFIEANEWDAYSEKGQAITAKFELDTEIRAIKNMAHFQRLYKIKRAQSFPLPWPIR